MKSFTFERECEFEYSEVVEISCAKEASGNQMFFGFGLAGFIMLVAFISPSLIFESQILLTSSKALYLLALILFFVGFSKKKFYYFSDKNGKTITFIKATPGNLALIDKIVKLIKTKSKNIEEITLNRPFDETKAIFELKDYDLPHYLNVTSVKFGKNMLVAHQKSMIGENLTVVKYDELTGKVIRGRENNDSWGSAFYLTLVLVTFIICFDYLFDILSTITFLYIGIPVMILLGVFFLLRYVKQELIGLYDKSGSVAYWTWVNKSNREKVEGIIKYVKSRIPVQKASKQ